MRRQLDRRSLVLGFGLVVVLGLSAPGAEAKTSGCLVINSAANTGYTSLQAAVNGAQAGATLWIRGTCTGTAEITKDMTLTGQRPGGFTAPTLDGGGQGSVLTVDSGVTLTVNTLTITGGSGTPAPGVAGRILGGGIASSDASVTLNDVSVSGNIAGSEGGGIVQGGGSLTLNDSTISGNTTGTGSGGLLAVDVSVTLNGSSSISGNTTKRGDGGGISLNSGSLTLNDTSTISDNSAAGDGGGAFIYAGSVTLNDSSSIRHNTAGWSGGGIYNLGGEAVTLNDTSSISANTAGIDGGGIDNSQWAGPVTVTGSSSITGNTPNNCAPPASIAGCTG